MQIIIENISFKSASHPLIFSHLTLEWDSDERNETTLYWTSNIQESGNSMLCTVLCTFNVQWTLNLISNLCNRRYGYLIGCLENKKLNEKGKNTKILPQHSTTVSPHRFWRTFNIHKKKLLQINNTLLNHWNLLLT